MIKLNPYTKRPYMPSLAKPAPPPDRYVYCGEARGHIIGVWDHPATTGRKTE